MALPVAGIYTRYRHLIPELIKFGIVGGTGAVIDLGGAAVLHGKYHVGPLESKAISTVVATVLTYLGSRYWTFKHRENQALGRELTLFIVLNLVGLFIAEAVIALVTYGLGKHSQLEYNAASVVGTGLATIFRYLAYRRWVFTAPAEPSAGIAPSAPEVQPFPDYPPWEADPAQFAAAPVMAQAAVSTATDPWRSAEAVSNPWAPTAEQDSWNPPTEHRSWEPAAEMRSWGQSDEATAPWMETSVISNEPVTSPLQPGARGQGRHRRS